MRPVAETAAGAGHTRIARGGQGECEHREADRAQQQLCCVMLRCMAQQGQGGAITPLRVGCRGKQPPARRRSHLGPQHACPADCARKSDPCRSRRHPPKCAMRRDCATLTGQHNPYIPTPGAPRSSHTVHGGKFTVRRHELTPPSPAARPGRRTAPAACAAAPPGHPRCRGRRPRACVRRCS